MAQYTKKAILQTFQEMLERMPFDKITVSALAARDVRRFAPLGGGFRGGGVNKKWCGGGAEAFPPLCASFSKT